MKVHGLLEKNDSYALRGVCMIMIIVHHTYLSAIDMPGCHTDSWLAGVGTGWLWGYGGTGVFLFLSGFGMFFSLRRNRLSGRAYIRSKFIRLFIPYLWLWAVSLIIYILYDSSQLTPRLLTSFLSLDIPPANEAWFYKVIIGLYVLSIVIFKVFRNPRACVLAVSSVCVAYYCLANYVLGMNPWWFITVLNFPSGMLTALFYDKLRHIQPVYVILPGTLLFALLQYFQPNNIKSAVLCGHDKRRTLREHQQPDTWLHRNKQSAVLLSRRTGDRLSCKTSRIQLLFIFNCRRSGYAAARVPLQTCRQSDAENMTSESSRGV